MSSLKETLITKIESALNYSVDLEKPDHDAALKESAKMIASAVHDYVTNCQVVAVVCPPPTGIQSPGTGKIIAP